MATTGNEYRYINYMSVMFFFNLLINDKWSGVSESEVRNAVILWTHGEEILSREEGGIDEKQASISHPWDKDKTVTQASANTISSIWSVPLLAHPVKDHHPWGLNLNATSPSPHVHHPVCGIAVHLSRSSYYTCLTPAVVLCLSSCLPQWTMK